MTRPAPAQTAPSSAAAEPPAFGPRQSDYEAKEFIAYFPFDQYILTPEAQILAQDAANYAKAGNPSRLTVLGYDDASHSPAYAMRLSERRAKAIAEALVGLGLPRSVLSVNWKGSTGLAVDTGPGSKEPLNRRVTIDIQF